MSTAISSLWVGIQGSMAGLANTFKAALAPVNSFTAGIESAGAKLVGTFSAAFRPIDGIVSGLAGVTAGAAAAAASVASLALVSAPLVAIAGAIAGVGKGIKLAADMEATTLAMETMLGSAEAAHNVLRDLTSFAASTPFETPELVDATKKLIAFGVAQEKLLPTLNAVGDIASGLNVPIGELSEIFGKAKVQGRLFAEDINQLQGRGIGITAELAKQFGVAESEVRKLVETGQVGFGNLERAFSDMTSAGGVFGGMMAKQSGTIGGMASTAWDTLNNALTRVGQTVIEAFNVKAGIGLFTVGLAKAGDAIVSMVNATVPTLKAFGVAAFDAFQGIYAKVAPVAIKIGRIASNLFTAALPAITSKAAGIWSAATKAFQRTYDAVKSVVVPMADAVTANWRRILDSVVGYGMAVGNAATAAWGALSDVAGWAWGKVADVWKWGLGAIVGETTAAGFTIRDAWQVVIDKGNDLRDAWAKALNAASFAINNWKDVATLAFRVVGLKAVTFANDVQFLFERKLPAVANWFARNWQGVLVTVFDYTSTVFRNLSENIGRFFQSIPQLMAGTAALADVWKPLTDGFRSTIAEALQLPERQMTALERSMTQGVDELNAKLASGLMAHLADQERRAKEASDAIAKSLSGAAGNIAPPKPIDVAVKPPEIPQPKPLTFDAKIDPGSLDLEIKPEIKRAKAIRAGSAEAQALRYLPAFQGGPLAPVAPQPTVANVPQPRQSAAMKDVVQDLLDKQLVEQRKIAGNTSRMAKGIDNIESAVARQAVVNF